MDTDYPVSIYRADETDSILWVAEYPDLPGCIGVGETREEALAEAEENKQLWLEAAKSVGKPWPTPNTVFSDEYSGRFNLRIPRSLHRQLSVRSLQEGTSLNALCSYLLAAGLNSERRTSLKVQPVPVSRRDPMKNERAVRNAPKNSNM